MKKILTVVLLVAALQLLIVSATYAAPPAWGGSGCGGQYHCVMWGETLHSIGRMYDASPYCISQANGLWDPNVIFAGQVLFIPSSCPPYPWQAINHPQPCQYDNCGWQQPVYHPWQKPVYHPQPYPPVYNPCGSGCYGQGYYGHGQDRNNNTCGYNNNCW